MLFHVDLREDMRYLSLFVDDKSDPLCQKTSDPKHAIGSCHFFAAVAQDGEWQIMLLCEFRMRFHAIDADAYHYSAFVLVGFVVVSEAASFGGAAWREVFRVEIENNDFAPEIIFQADWQPTFVQQRKIWSGITNVEFGQKHSHRER